MADLLAARQADGRIANHALPELSTLCEALEQPPPPGLARLGPIVGAFEKLPDPKKTEVKPVTETPKELQTYAVIFHDIENATARGTTDTLHWSMFNIPGTAKGLPEGLGAGDLPDGSRNGPGINARGGNPGSYFGPGAGPGPFHHYVFEFYALDTKLDLPATTTRDELLKAMEGHVIGKAAYVGRFHAPPPQ